MEFKTNIFELNTQKSITFQLMGTPLPTGKDIFFRAKQKEIFEQYENARIFLRKTETTDWNYWFTYKDPQYQEMIELTFKGMLYETALIYYNIIVDLTWTLCYVSAEYVIYENNKTIDINHMIPIDEAYHALRKAEKAVTNPGSKENPFEYLKNMCPEFNESINLIIEFWNDFADSNIRTLYNFIKHKGKPIYEEIEKYRPGKLMHLVVNDKNYPSDIRDVQIKINLKHSIDELQKFDDNILFPYIKFLFNLLEKAVDPSPMIF